MVRLTFVDNNEDRIISGDGASADIDIQDTTGARSKHKPGGHGLVFIATIIFCLAAAEISSVAGQLFEGSACRTRNGTYGLCKAHRHCVWAMDGYRERAFTINDMVRCGFHGRDELICCLDEMPDQSTTTESDSFIFHDNDVAVSTARPTPAPVAPTPVPIRLGDRRKALAACDRFVRDYSVLTFHILGGEETSLGDFPHMAALGFPDTSSDQTIEWRCGGTLVSENYVLTAAHCLTRQQPTVVRLGQVDLNMSTPDSQDIPVAQIVMHPDYIPSRNYHDIALLRLERNASMSENVHPACLRTAVADVPNEQLIITGWGDMDVEKRQRSSILLKANIPAVDLQDCNRTYSEQPRERRLPNLLQMGHLCANDPKLIADACQGDSGGPLQIIQPNNFAMVVGVVSFGTGCGTGIPSVFARVAFYVDWLESVIWPN